jgi:hypothetical protein
MRCRPSPGSRERSFESSASRPLSRTAGEGAERSEAGEGLWRGLNFLQGSVRTARKSAPLS